MLVHYEASGHRDWTHAPLALKVSDHHVRSPLLNIDPACQTCRKISEEELRERVYTIQGRTFQTRNIAIDALLDLVRGIERVRGSDSTDPKVVKAQRYQRAAQFFADFVEAENSMGFHADQEASASSATRSTSRAWARLPCGGRTSPRRCSTRLLPQPCGRIGPRKARYRGA